MHYKMHLIIVYPYLMSTYCVCDITALEIIRSSGRLIPGLLDAPRTSLLSSCAIPPRIILEEDMTRAGAVTKPYHLLVGSENNCHRRDDIICHRRTTPLPRRSLIRVTMDFRITSPEYTFLQLAASGKYDEIDLALIGLELCGTYLLDSSWDGFTNTEVSATAKAKIAHFLEHEKGHTGVALARRAADLILDASHSPMESVLAAFVTFPRRLGGLGLGPASLNHVVTTENGTRKIDLSLYQEKIGLEYKGKRYHAIEQSGRDDRRQNAITASGYTIFNVWYEDLVQDHLFQALASQISSAMSKRLRIRGRSFETRQRLLRMRLLPAFKSYDSQ